MWNVVKWLGTQYWWMYISNYANCFEEMLRKVNTKSIVVGHVMSVSSKNIQFVLVYAASMPISCGRSITWLQNLIKHLHEQRFKFWLSFPLLHLGVIMIETFVLIFNYKCISQILSCRCINFISNIVIFFLFWLEIWFLFTLLWNWL